MQSASAVLNSSNSECTPNSLLEAMKIGTPVIARDIPGVRSIVKNGETGMLYTTPEEFITICERVLSDPSLVSELTQNARSYIDNNHSLEAEAENYKKLLEELLI